MFRFLKPLASVYLAFSLSTVASAENCKVTVGGLKHYDVIRMAQGQMARELYEKMYEVPSKEVPEGLLGDQIQSVDLKEISLYNGNLRIKVARVAHNEFNLENLMSSEPLYYAQVLVARPEIKKLEKDSKYDPIVKTGDKEISIKLPIAFVTADYRRKASIKDDNGTELSDLLTLSEAKEPTDRNCTGGVCVNGKYFIKWEGFRANDVELHAERIKIPFGAGEGAAADAVQPVKIIVNNTQETFWGDVKKTLNWFFGQ